MVKSMWIMMNILAGCIRKNFAAEPKLAFARPGVQDMSREMLMGKGNVVGRLLMTSAALIVNT